MAELVKRVAHLETRLPVDVVEGEDVLVHADPYNWPPRFQTEPSTEASAGTPYAYDADGSGRMPDTSDEMRNQYAELLYATRDYAEAYDQYLAVVAMDPAG